MKRKRKHHKNEERETEKDFAAITNDDPEKVVPQEEEQQTEESREHEETAPAGEEEVKVQPPKHTNIELKQKKFKPAYARVSVDPTRQYRTPESRESWGPNVKGKKFRKEKGKKKRCPNAGCRIDGAVKSVRLDV